MALQADSATGPENILFVGASVHLSTRIFLQAGAVKGLRVVAGAVKGLRAVAALNPLTAPACTIRVSGLGVDIYNYVILP